ncbi:hypothetical protein GQ607_007221 [Colletotrichum asianum]|uniref:Uncharacterized protein n=1 Tax=Colletotrichum asianum TaxID=702518 RepID=A0A8H3WFP2_9PEZI|nr:hypothetical protein GQ607_007221 [Colletotrichum asianum]
MACLGLRLCLFLLSVVKECFDRKRRTRDRVGCGLGSGGLNGTGSGWGWGMGIRRGLGRGNRHGRRGGDGTRQSNATAHRADEGQRGNQSWIGKSARTDLVKTDRGVGDFGPVETSRSIPGRDERIASEADQVNGGDDNDVTTTTHDGDSEGAAGRRATWATAKRLRAQEKAQGSESTNSIPNGRSVPRLKARQGSPVQSSPDRQAREGTRSE